MRKFTQLKLQVTRYHSHYIWDILTVIGPCCFEGVIIYTLAIEDQKNISCECTQCHGNAAVIVKFISYS